MPSILFLGAILIVGFSVVIYLLGKRTKKTDDTVLLEWLKSMQIKIDETNRTVNETLRVSNDTIAQTLHSNTQALNARLDNAARVISQVQKNIGEMSEIGRGMKDLNDFLKSPKLRGNIGEQVLKELLGQMLPKQSFHLQYGFKSGVIVDAAIRTDAGIIPIDSKFPLENFRKLNSAENDTSRKVAEKDFISDVKKHVDDISKKYIITNEGTIDYALMYVPSEAVYYEIVNNPTLFDYASKHRILPVSPMTFYAYLKAILMGFEGQKISEKAREILFSIKSVQKEYEKMNENIDTLARHIQNSYNMMIQVQSGMTKLGRQITTTAKLEIEEKVPLKTIISS